MAKKEKLDFLSFTKDEKRNQIFKDFSLISEKKSKNKRIANGQQTDSKGIARKKPIELVGNEKLFLDFIFNLCKKNASLETPNLSLEYITFELKLSSKQLAKNIIYRVCQKQVVIKISSKTGRGGWSKFALPNEVYNKLYCEIDSKNTSKRIAKRIANKPSSSINIYTKNKTTTTLRSVDSIETPGDSVKAWQEIDFSLLTKIGFKDIHISQLLTKGDLTPEEVQESIYAFAYDIEHNPSLLRIKTTPLNLFLGILKRGCPYFPSKEYDSVIKRQYDKHQKERERRKLQDEQIVDQHRNQTFADWVEKLSLKEKSEILDIDIGFMSKMPIQAVKDGLFEYFKLKVYEPLG